MKKTVHPTPKRAWVFALAVSAGVAGYVLLVFLPGQRATAELREQFTQQQRYVLQSAQLGAKISHLEKEVQRAQRFNDSWHASAPSEERLAHVFVKITEHANLTGAEIVRLEPQPAEKLDHVQRVPVEMAVEGTFAQLFQFVGRLESLDAEFWIEMLEIQPVTAVPGRLRCELKMALFAGGGEISD